MPLILSEVYTRVESLVESCCAHLRDAIPVFGDREGFSRSHTLSTRSIFSRQPESFFYRADLLAIASSHTHQRLRLDRFVVSTVQALQTCCVSFDLSLLQHDTVDAGFHQRINASNFSFE